MRIMNNNTGVAGFALERAFQFGAKSVKSKYVKRRPEEIRTVTLGKLHGNYISPCVLVSGKADGSTILFTPDCNPYEAMIVGAVLLVQEITNNARTVDTFVAVGEFRNNRGAKILLWHVPPKRVKRQQPPDRALAKARAHVAAWTRRMKLAKTKLSKYTRAVRRLEKKLAQNAVA